MKTAAAGCGRAATRRNGRAEGPPRRGGVAWLGVALVLWALSACTTVDREQLAAYSAAFEAARQVAAGTLAEARAAAERQGLDLAADLATREQVLAVVAAYNAVLVRLADAGDAEAAADDATRLAEALASLAGAALAPLAGEVAVFAQPIGMVVARIDELLARERYGDVASAAGPTVEELLELLAADGPALHAIISAPTLHRQDEALAQLAATSFEFQQIAAGHGEAADVAALRAQLDHLRAQAALPAGVAPLEPLAAAGDAPAPPHDMQRLRELVAAAEAEAADLSRCRDLLAAQEELTRRYQAALLAARDAMRALRAGVEGEPGDAAAAIELLLEQARWFRAAYQAYQEAKA